MSLPLITYTYSKNSYIQTHQLNELQNKMEEHNLLSLKQSSDTLWLSLERAVKCIRTNWVALLLELEEETAKDCLVLESTSNCTYSLS